MGKSILIAYFSRSGDNYLNGSIKNLSVGNTEIAARKIQDIAGGDLFQIVPIKSYSQDYRTCTEEAQQELRANARPELARNLENLDGYDTVVLGYPNWWGTMPMPVWTFLERHDFSGKNILPLCTHEGSEMGKSEADIRKLCHGANVKRGLAIRGSNVKDAGGILSDWLKELL